MVSAFCIPNQLIRKLRFNILQPANRQPRRPGQSTYAGGTRPSSWPAQILWAGNAKQDDATNRYSKTQVDFDEKYSLCLFFDSQPAKGGKAKGGKYGAGKFTKRAPSTRSARAGLQVSSQVRFCNVLVYWSVMGHFDSEKVLFMISSDLYSFEIRKSLFIIWDYRLRSPQTVFW